MGNITNNQAEGASGLFASVMSAVKSGQKLVELDDALRHVTEAVGKLGQAGKVTLEITISPAGTGVGEVPLFSVAADVAVKAPKVKAKPETFFADENFNLTRRSPKQQEMQLRIIENEKTTPAAAEPIQSKAAANA